MKFCLKLLVTSLGLVTIGCATGGPGGAHHSGASKTTGWKYNDPKYGAFEVYEMYDQPTPPGMVFIPGGTFTMGMIAEDVPYGWNNPQRKVSIDAFYIDVTEIRNIDYREYIHWLNMVYVSHPEVGRRALPDTLAWRKPLGYNESFVEFYFRFTPYNEYPVVAVSWLQASDYCVWRTDRVNEAALINSGVLDFSVADQKDDDNFNTETYLVGEYTGVVKRNLPDLSGRNPDGRTVRYEDGIIFPKFRLPTEAEWEYAAMASIGDAATGVLSGRNIYPWKGNRVRQTEGLNKTLLMANFQKGRGDLMGIASNPNGNAPRPVPVTSFWPNDFGLYCMAGNVNEWVLDVYRALSFEDVEDARPFRGNIYTAPSKDEEGHYIKDELGRLKKDTIGYVNNRPNYLVGDNRNYHDGDIVSAISTGEDMEKKEETVNSNKMYYQGQGEKRQGMSSLVNEQSRVYKGGSFMDRAYYLSPGARRFLDEAKSKEDIGFRCAMDRLGDAKFKPTAPTSK
ncbi:MAG: SUMF1/EgtB/PvdO family nonheme iron enzyme [Prevotellaceae bacterium]|jgi:gliding motility-associated lipoprotein GldJ|nr:SUMF1/EgtB/PvdO family nonheme iron enzyme [Prevotellaceae bacterium]